MKSEFEVLRDRIYILESAVFDVNYKQIRNIIERLENLEKGVMECPATERERKEGGKNS